jgi:hypothetical protein
MVGRVFTVPRHGSLFYLWATSFGCVFLGFVWFAFLTPLTGGCKQYGPGPYCFLLIPSSGTSPLSSAVLILSIILVGLAYKFYEQWILSVCGGALAAIGGYLSWTYCMNFPAADYSTPPPAAVLWFTVGLGICLVGAALAIISRLLVYRQHRPSTEIQPSPPDGASPPTP